MLQQKREKKTFLSGQSILVIGTDSWFGPLLSKHHLVLELCKQNNVLYLEPFYHAGKLLRGRLPQDLYHERYHDEQPSTLIRLQPWRLPKSEMLPVMRSLSEKLLLARLRLRNFQPRVIISFSPHFIFLKEKLGVPFIYYCVDHQTDGAAEAATLRRADLVVAATKVLYERFRGRTRRLEYLPHGVSPAALNQDSLTQPADIAAVPHPIAGYVGAVNSTLDINLCERLIRAQPHLSLVLVGPYEKDSFAGKGLPSEWLNRLHSLPNTYLFGPRPSRQLGAYINSFDVCLIPYDILHPRVHFSYHKVLQYLAMGKPVVTTCAADSSILPPHVAVAETPEAFIAAVNRALADHDEAAKRRCRAFAGAQTWDKRVEQLAEWVEQVI